MQEKITIKLKSITETVRNNHWLIHSLCQLNQILAEMNVQLFQNILRFKKADIRHNAL